MRTSFKTGLVAAASALALAPQAFAQTAGATGQASQATQLDEIVVSSSRIDRSGFEAPTPTTVIGIETLEQRAIVNVADALNDIPSFRAAVTPSASGLGNTGAYLADLRGLGPTRTLVLLDKGRLPQTTTPGGAIGAGVTDLNIIPTALIRSTDVVTGGASAAYGSDAVAGVVNLVLDDRLEGLKANVQYGQTQYGDSQDKFVSLAGGRSFMDGRLHIIAGGEYNENDGTDYRSKKRDWEKKQSQVVTYPVRAAGVPNIYLGPNVYFGQATDGGLIQTAGPLRGLAFVTGANGATTTVPFAPGLGGLGNNFDVFSPQAIAQNQANGIRNEVTAQLRPEVERANFLAKATFDISDRLSFYVQPLFSHTETSGIIIARRDGSGAGPGLNIAADNYYLQRALTPAQLASVPVNGLTIGYLGNQFGPNERHIKRDTVRVQTGFTGDINDKWSWDAAYVYGQSRSKIEITNNFNNLNFRNAIDAVLVNGQVVCRSAVARANGCVPINILGTPVLPAGANAYLFGGTASGTAVTELQEVSANVQGEAFSTWAGPISIGFGADYRIESLKVTTDPLSQAAVYLTGTGQPLARVENTVTEGYIETIVPLLADQPFANSLDFNGAVRLTNYSNSGNVTTWKAGLTWDPGAGLSFRTTRSRDIRAPNLLDLFTPVTPQLPLPVDPRPGVPPITNSPGVTAGGNPNLTPEKSTTQTFGVVYRPTFIEGLQASVDYYDIRIEDAIAATSVANVVTNCFPGGIYSGNAFCSLITFANNDPLRGQITAIRGTSANVAEFKTRGIDFSLRYRQPLSTFFSSAPGDLTLNLQATHVIEFSSTTDVSALFPSGLDRAGQTGAAFGGAAGLPDWYVNLTVNYEVNRLNLNANVRYIDESLQNNAFTGPDQPNYNPASPNSTNDNTIPAYAYLDLGVSYNFGNDDKRRQVYLNIDNVFNKEPPIPAYGSAYYDLMGRTYKAGVRYAF